MILMPSSSGCFTTISTHRVYIHPLPDLLSTCGRVSTSSEAITRVGVRGTMSSIFVTTAIDRAADKSSFGGQTNVLVRTISMLRHWHFTFNLADCVGNFVYNCDK